jgi:two-component system, cell cycle response regulator DivK
MAKILVVEDDPLIQVLLTRMLGLQQHVVIVAADGLQGVERARIDRPALILMDMGLPIMNGWQATHRIRCMPLMRTTPIVAITAFAMKEDQIKCLAAGCDAYQTKPIDFGQLFQTIDTLLGR